MSCMNTFADAVRAEMDAALPLLKEETFLPAAQIIWDAQANGNRIHITGIGKPAHIAGYMASLMSSTGTPTEMSLFAFPTAVKPRN